LDKNKYFILGNIVLAVALLMLVNIDSLWEKMGAAAMGLWVAVFGLGVYLMYHKPKD
jgi:hypothetical protein